MLITLSHYTVICQLVAEVQLTGVAPLGSTGIMRLSPQYSLAHTECSVQTLQCEMYVQVAYVACYFFCDLLGQDGPNKLCSGINK